MARPRYGRRSSVRALIATLDLAVPVAMAVAVTVAAAISAAVILHVAMAAVLDVAEARVLAMTMKVSLFDCCVFC